MKSRLLALTLLALTLLALAPSISAEVWGVKTLGPNSDPPSTLFRFSADGTSFAILGIITLEGVQVEVDGLAVDAGGTLFAYVAGDASCQLITIDPTSAVATAVGAPLSGREIRGAAFDRDGTLVGLDFVSGAIVRVDPATGLPIAPDMPLSLEGEPFVPPFSTDLAIAADGRAILGVNPLYDVDLTTGALTEFHDDAEPGPDGIQPHAAGLAFPPDPADARLLLYDISFDDDIFAYDLAPPHSRTLVFGDIIPGYNAGRGDLASWPTMATAVGDAGPPTSPMLLSTRPNPFNPRTEIVFRLPAAATVNLEIFDLRGRLVRSLHTGSLPAGEHRAMWDGRADDGRSMPSGTYACRLVADQVMTMRAMTLVR